MRKIEGKSVEVSIKIVVCAQFFVFVPQTNRSQKRCTTPDLVRVLT